MISIFKYWLWVYLTYNLFTISSFYWNVIWVYLTYILFALIIFTLKIQNLSLAVIQFSIFFFVSLLILGNVNSYLFMWFVMYFQVWKTWLSSVFFRSNSTGGKVHDTLCISLIFIWFWTASNQPLIRINLQFALRPVLWRTSVWCMGWSVGGWKSDNTWGGCKLSRWEVGVAAQGLWKDSIQQICGWSCCPSQ